ncbi:hypothetical protein HDV06_004610 [Boothiomyces sp. JEL0866]|nr:hypothetical protein HDV06_004610 [Boothiomyces sp. JEL0866]
MSDFENAVEKFYGLYKTAMLGKCNTPQPGYFEFRERAKWDAWNKVNMTKEQAQQAYVELLSTVSVAQKEGEIAEGDEKLEGVKVSVMVNEGAVPSQNTIFDHIQNGDINKVKEHLPCNLVDANGMTPLMWAADGGHLEIMKLLNTDLDVQDLDGNTALHYALLSENQECADYLISKGARQDIMNSDNETALSLK